ncbi:MAG: rRNA maturation RNase YbeY [Flavobacteriia bacterium]|nr:rRNA maturation RNase YbeY [Flavobacteriia bacterium]
MLKVQQLDADFSYKFKKKLLYNNLRFLANKEGKNISNLIIYLCSDEGLLKINKEHLNHDYYTDIITFDYSNNSNLNLEMYISTDRIIENAKKYKVPILIEFYRVCLHGLLHCCGYKDKTKVDQHIMRNKENEYLQLFSS